MKCTDYSAANKL